MGRPRKPIDPSTPTRPRKPRGAPRDPFRAAERLHSRWGTLQTRADAARLAYESVIASAQADLDARQEALRRMGTLATPIT